MFEKPSCLFRKNSSLKMSFSDEDCEILIEIIRQHPPLYDAQLDSYRDENLKDNIWISIAEMLSKTDPECRRKWKHIRDSYNRYKRKQKKTTGSAAPTKNSKWQFYERLRFLDKIPSERQSCTSVGQGQQSSASVEKEVANTSPGLENEDTAPDAAHTSGHNTPSNELPGTSKSTQERPNIPRTSSEKSIGKNTKRKRQNEDEFIKFMKDRNENLNRQLELLKSQESVDDISSFTKHIETMLRKLSARSRALAKTEIFNIVSKYEIGDIEGQSERSYTSSYYNSYSPTTAASSGLQAQNNSSRQLPYNSKSSYNSYSPILRTSSQHQTHKNFDDLTNLP